MATYAAAGSNGSMESWYPLVGFVESRIWAQMMRQISRRAADVGITCNWRNGVVNPGSAVQYPTDDFLVGLAADPLAVCQEYMEQIFGTLEDVCEAQFLDDCKLWFFAPNEASLPYCSGLDGPEPMTFTVPTLVEDRTKWKEWMTKMRQVVDALDRLKTVWPIPHPGSLYPLVRTVTATYSKMGHYLGTPTKTALGRESYLYDIGAPWPARPTDGYCLDPDDDHVFPGWDELDGTNIAPIGSPIKLSLICPYNAPLYPYAGDAAYGAVATSDTDAKLRSWSGVGKVTYTGTAKISDANWSAFVAAYGEVVNSIEWSYDLDPRLSVLGPEGNLYDALSGDITAITASTTGGGAAASVGNAGISFSMSIELNLNAQVFRLFDNSGTPRVIDCATLWKWEEVPGDFYGVEQFDYTTETGNTEYAEGGGASAEWTCVFSIEPSSSSVTACD